MPHSSNLQETKLWNVYLEKIKEEKDKATDRQNWIEKIYSNSINELKYVVNTFPNYTLHDEVHVLNVLDAIAGILGNDVYKLSSGECELLIAVSAMHDLGMVYRTENDKTATYQNKRFVIPFLQNKHPELIGTDISKCDKDNKDYTDIQQDLLRYAHPFRVDEVISSNQAWNEVFTPTLPVRISRKGIIAVCEAHGKEPSEFIEGLESLESETHKVDYLFCAFLLRLADLLDFDDTRAPSVLIDYSKVSGISIEEWKKHKSSWGFNYPETPSENDLPYSATSTDPNLEHTINNFLSWIDDELLNCVRFRRLFSKRWQDFLFPSKIKREIEPIGYVSGEFLLTMDHVKVLELLSGSDLYDQKWVFIRELLQNSIDAIRLRSEMDSKFSIEDGRIDLWDWHDENGDRWFRIDDNGTGMTLGIIKRFFLKVGNSYYNSNELKRNLYRFTKNADLEYQGISQFGIGFLSCFLCGNNIDISTLYFNDEISELDIGKKSLYGYGIRLSIPQLTGYYTVRCQSEKNHCSPMKSHYLDNLGEKEYRDNPGTSILIHLNKDILDDFDIKKYVDHLVLGTSFPIYFNNEKVGLTKKEVCILLKEHEGIHEYEICSKEKEKFDNAYPMLKGKYPRIFSITHMFSGEADPCWNNSIVIVSRFWVDTSELNWKYKDTHYQIEYTNYGYANEQNGWELGLELNKNGIRDFNYLIDEKKKKYDDITLKNLFDCFEGFEVCPNSPRSLGNAWDPFDGNETITEMWDCYIESKNRIPSYFSLTMSDERILNLIKLLSISNVGTGNFSCYYNGIRMENENEFYAMCECVNSACVILEGKWQIPVNLSRNRITSLPTEILLGVNVLSLKSTIPDSKTGFYQLLPGVFANALTQKEWLSVLESEYGHWAVSELSKNETEFDVLHLFNKFKNYRWSYTEPLSLCAVSYFSTKYELCFDYPELKLHIHSRKAPDEFSDLPPFIFCHSTNNDTRKFAYYEFEADYMGQDILINLDHDVIKWILTNRTALNIHFTKYYKMILRNLYYYSEFSSSVNRLYNYLKSLPESQRHGIDISNFRELSDSDFLEEKIKDVIIFDDDSGNEL